MESDTPQNMPKKQRRPLGNLGKRIVTGAVYLLILIAAFVLKIFVGIDVERANGEIVTLRLGNFFFDALLLAFSAVGTFEMLRAFGDHLIRVQKVFVMIFSVLGILAYSVADYYFADILGVRLPTEGIAAAHGRNYALHVAFVAIVAGFASIISLLVFCHGKVTLESTGYSLFCCAYPSLLLVIVTICNHLERYSELAIMFIFAVPAAADSLAFFFGKLFGKRFPAKMAPNISPNKTIVGGLGGILGGALGAVIVFFIGYGLSLLDEAGVHTRIVWDLDVNALNILFFIAVGVLTSAFSQFGDLAESAIKRKLGIKDMGKILPGHGGILDRIDSALYAGLIVCLVFVLRIMFMG